MTSLRHYCALFMLILSLVSSPFFAATTQQFILDNGLEVVLISDPNASVASVRTVIRSGSIHEAGHYGSGLAHYLEHLVSGGTTTKRSEKEYRDLVAQCGGASNAYTTLDHTAYFIHTTPDKLNLAVNVIYEWMFYNDFSRTEFLREKSVVLKELERGKASVYRQAYAANQANFYAFHPMQYPVIGYRALVENTTEKAIRSFYQAHYVPSNMILVVGGNFELGAMRKQIESSFGTVPGRAKPQSPVADEPPIVSPKKRTIYTHTTTARSSFRFPSIRFGDDDLYALDLLAYVFGEGVESIAYQELVEEKKLAFSVHVSSYTPIQTTGFFEIQVESKPENREAVKKELMRLIAELKEGDFDRKRIKAAKKQKRSEEVFAMGNMQRQVEQVSLSMLYSHHPNYFKEYANRFESVSEDDLTRVARAYLNPQRLVLTETLPMSFKDDVVQAAERQIPEGPTQITLNNGMKIWLKADRRAPKVSLTVMIKGGLREEDRENAGLSTITASALGQGSKWYSKKTFQKTFDQSGASYSASLGNNSWYATMSTLKEDFEDLWPVFSDGVWNAKVEKDAFAEIKRQQLNAIDTQKDHWRAYTRRIFLKWFYGDHPYGQSKLGSPESLERISIKTVHMAQQSLLRPEDTVVTVVGDFNKEEVKEMLIKSLGKLKRRGPKSRHEAPIPKHHRANTEAHKIPQDLAVVTIAYDGLSLDQYEQFALMDVLDTVLSGYRYPGGRLHDTLRGEGLVYEVHAFHIPLIDTGYFMIQAVTDPQNKDKVVKEIQAIIEELKEKGVETSELNLAKSQLLYHQALAESEIEGLSQLVASNLTFFKKWDEHRKRPKAIRKVQKRDVQRLAKDLFVAPQVLVFD